MNLLLELLIRAKWWMHAALAVGCVALGVWLEGYGESAKEELAQALAAPAPDKETVTRLLTIAGRAPDHGKLEPWRFLVLDKPALERLAGPIVARIFTLRPRGSILAKRRPAASAPDETGSCVFMIPPNTRIGMA